MMTSGTKTHSIFCSRWFRCSVLTIFLTMLVVTFYMDYWSIEFNFTEEIEPKVYISELSYGHLNNRSANGSAVSQDRETTRKSPHTYTTTISATATRTRTFSESTTSPSTTLTTTVSNTILLPSFHVDEISCPKLIGGDMYEEEKAMQYMEQHPYIKTPDAEFISLASDCPSFINMRRYVMHPLSEEEEMFPVAFSILLFKDVEQFERLLRAIYHPQNYYCVHVDDKSHDDVWKATQAITKCFDNVILASKRSVVEWGTWTVLEPELTCMSDLLNYKKWKYFINLTGQEFPLKTNLDLVQILKIYNGANNMEGTVKRMNTDRVKDKLPAPHDITVTKGSVHITASRGFVEFVINDPRVKDFETWLKDTWVPDETFFSSLNHSPQLGVPGAYTGEPETDTQQYLFLTRFKNWGTYPFNWDCAGERVRQVCILSVGDLPLLATRPELFANKFYLESEYLALGCMEELHFNRTLSQVRKDGIYELKTDIYHKMSFVHNHI